MSGTSRRSFLLRTGGTGLGVAFAGSLGQVLDATAAGTQPGPGSSAPGRSIGYGPLVPDTDGILDLPEGFRYKIFSRQSVDTLPGGRPVPGGHDGMAAFRGGSRRDVVLVRNHELDLDDIEEDGLTPVPHVEGHTYDRGVAAGGTTTLELDSGGDLLSHRVSLAGTIDNCAGGVTPWGTWLTCEETTDTVDGVPHGYVFEVDPVHGGNPVPIKAMGRFEHEAVAFDRRGVAYLTEDGDGPHGYFYRFQPNQPRRGRGSLHAGGQLSAMLVPEVGTDGDISAVTEPGTVLGGIRWVPIDNPDPADGGDLRRMYDATHIQKCEGTWTDRQGNIWFVSSRGDGPDAEDPDDVSVNAHGGQIWLYSPVHNTLKLVTQFAPDDDFEGPDNITISPYGYAVMCTDGEDDDQFLAGITPEGDTFPLGYNRASDDEFAGACFSPDRRTLYVNIQEPGTTFAIQGPWNG